MDELTVDEPTTGQAAAGRAAPGTLLRDYLGRLGTAGIDPTGAAFRASVDAVAATDPEVADAMLRGLDDRQATIELAPGGNYCSPAVGGALAYPPTGGYAGDQCGCDAIEARAVTAARELFGAGHAHVRPHSGDDANLVALLAVLAVRGEAPRLAALGQEDPAALPAHARALLRENIVGQRLLGPDPGGYRPTVSARLFRTHTYGVDAGTGLLDMAAVRERAREVRPAVLLAGHEAYPAAIDHAAFREIADEVGATLMVDMAHVGGLVAGGVLTGDHDPVAHAEVVTSATHGTLRGPRGGLVLATTAFADAMGGAGPTALEGPPSHAVAAKAVAFREALTPAFRRYAAAVVDNARTLADRLAGHGARIVTGGTDTHIVLLDTWSSYRLTGRQAESVLRECGLTASRGALPLDPHGPRYTSGLRLGTQATTTLGMGADETVEIADMIATALTSAWASATASGISEAGYMLPVSVRTKVHGRAADLLARFRPCHGIDLGATSVQAAP